ncbi:unnamed protein product [Clonostachys rosea]|uniref:NAD(P)-binding domain-containing protein n=1 Tax=Bionectria ochroleuca TaxID=29856 RepID=A0ABY6U6U5_BIOOC|nr:unnamed protein product [Clonostachys rosea]
MEEQDQGEPKTHWGKGSLKIIQQSVKNGSYEKLSPDDCIKAYAKSILDDRANVVVVLEPPKDCNKFANSSMLAYYTTSEPHCGPSMNTSVYASIFYRDGLVDWMPPGRDWFAWICSLGETEAYFERLPRCSSGAWKNQMNPATWTIGTAKVSYCLSEKLENQCQLKVALSLIYVVILFNALKVVIIVVLAASDLVNQEPLVTIGDAAASFIDCPERATKDMCLLSSTDVHKAQKVDSYQGITTAVYQSRKNRYSKAVSPNRWILASILTAVALVTLTGLLGYGLYDLNSRFSRADGQSLWDLGVGGVNPYTLIGWDIPRTGEVSVIASVLITNLPQLLISLLYLILNSSITSMAAAIEWSKYAHGAHRPLRVSFPKGGQRSTYFLQLPYRYGVPMLSLSVLIHWLVSQSLFVVQTLEKLRWVTRDDESEYADSEGWVDGKITTAPAYSPMAIILTIVTMLLICGGTGYVATELIRQGLALPQITNLVVLSRRPVTVPDSANASKLKQVLIDKYDEYPENVKKEFVGVNGCIWTVAITPTKSTQYDFEVVRNVCQTSTMAFLNAFMDTKPTNKLRFIYMSGSPCERDQTKRPWFHADYLLMRGETESKVDAFAKEHSDHMEAQVVKPALITSTATFTRGAAHVVLKGLSSVLGFIQYVTVQEISAAMLSQVVNGFEKDVLSSDELQRMGQDVLSKGEE